MPRYQSSIPISFDAADDEEAADRLTEITDGIDWSPIPVDYNVAYSDPGVADLAES